MNLLDATVTKIVSEPHEKYGKWWVRVEYNCWGHPGQTEIMCTSLEEALEIKVGHIFLT